MKFLLIAIAVIIIALLAVIILRTLRFKPKPGPKVFENEEKVGKIRPFVCAFNNHQEQEIVPSSSALRVTP